ncbi:MAG: hypothetical protein NTW40_05830 [Acidobacteria bacterium]|nr:hypothetical protein [Acidobacteriota bacterium]
MRFLRLCAAFLAASALALATEIPTYQVRLKVAPDGSGQAMATLRLGHCPAGLLVLPLGFSAPENLKLEEAPPGVSLELGRQDTVSSLRFHLPAALEAPATVRFSFRVKQALQTLKAAPGEKGALPAGSRLFRHGFVNTQETPIGSYRLEFLFPEGLIAQAVREQLPRLEKGEVGPRVLLSVLDGQQAASLTYANVHQGDVTSMVVELVPRRRSLGWLVAGLLLAGLYLFYFRDLVAKKAP